MVEKPMATTMEDADAMIAACRRAGVALTVNYSFRYLPKIQKARELVEAGALGDITGVQIIAHQFKDPGYWMGARSNSPDDWRSSREKCGGGFLIMNVCHTIDYLYFITGLQATPRLLRVRDGGVTRRRRRHPQPDVPLGRPSASAASARARSCAAGDAAEERIWGTKGTLVLELRRAVDLFDPADRRQEAGPDCTTTPSSRT